MFSFDQLQAAALFEVENSTSEANKCRLKIAQYSADLERFPVAIDIFENIAKTQVDNNLLKFSAKGNLLNAGLCRLNGTLSWAVNDTFACLVESGCHVILLSCLCSSVRQHQGIYVEQHQCNFVLWHSCSMLQCHQQFMSSHTNASVANRISTACPHSTEGIACASIC